MTGSTSTYSIGCHRHGEELNRDIVVEWFEDVFRKERMIDASIFVLVQLRQLPLPDVHHRVEAGGELRG